MDKKARDLSKYRFDLAEETLKNDKMCLENSFYRDCINRSYYATFYAIKAVLAVEGVDFKRHKDAVGYFNKQYVATEIFPKEVGRKISRQKMSRETSDYDDFYIASKEEAEKQLYTSEYIIPLVKSYLFEQGIVL